MADKLLPFVLIGHSKLFTSVNARGLRPFLDHIKENSERFRFGTFEDVCGSVRSIG